MNGGALIRGVFSTLKQAIVRCGYYSRPSFLILGAARCGTTALHRYLCTHPQVCSAWDKEIRYFDQRVMYDRGPVWYHSRFPLPHRRQGRKTFEATPDYLFTPASPERIHHYDPHLKLIAILRDPVDRAYSCWNMLRCFHEQRGRPILEEAYRLDPPVVEAYHRLFGSDPFPSFESMVRAELDHWETQPLSQPNLVRYGVYAEQILRYWERFPREQLWIIDHRRLFQQTRATLDAVTDFLELSRQPWDDRVDCKVMHMPYQKPLAETTRQLLRDFYRPYNRQLYDLLGRDFGW